MPRMTPFGNGVMDALRLADGEERRLSTRGTTVCTVASSAALERRTVHSGGIAVDAVGGLREAKRDNSGLTVENYWLINNPLNSSGYYCIGLVSKNRTTLENLQEMWHAPEIVR